MSYQQGPRGRRSAPYRQRGVEDSRYGPNPHPHLGSFNRGGPEEERHQFGLPEPVREREYLPPHPHPPAGPSFPPTMSPHFSHEAEFAYDRESFGRGGEGGGISVGHDHRIPISLLLCCALYNEEKGKRKEEGG